MNQEEQPNVSADEQFNNQHYWRMPMPDIQTPREKEVKDLKKTFDAPVAPFVKPDAGLPAATPRRSDVPVAARVAMFQKEEK
jgi:hypothetical protein